MYSGDPLVRRSPPLQKTRHAESPVAWVSPALYRRLGLVAGDFLRVRQQGGEAIVPVAVDERLPEDCIRLAAARLETAALGAMFGTLTAERVAGEQKVAV
jgi:NADH-quinone oxidoreductase subunit G